MRLKTSPSESGKHPQMERLLKKVIPNHSPPRWHGNDDGVDEHLSSITMRLHCVVEGRKIANATITNELMTDMMLTVCQVSSSF